MTTPTPLEFIRELLPDENLSDEELTTLRDLVDAQADLILDSYIASKMSAKDSSGTM